MTAPIVLPLAYPVDRKNAASEVVERISELSLGRLNGKKARAVLNAREKGSGEMTAALVCASADIPPSTFDLLDAQDIAAAMEIASGFFGIAPPTSST